jgi:L-threonylcarbamoyladenylate synthase
MTLVGKQHNLSLLHVCIFFGWMVFGISRSGIYYTRSICWAFETTSRHKRALSTPFSRLNTAAPVRGISAQLQNKMVITDDSAVLSPDDDRNNKRVEAKLVSVSELESCGSRLREGNLVAFPTETVYGLGCNALDPSAIIKVFEAKERPLTDPLISHIIDNEVAYDLWNADASSLEGKALRYLCEKFWPGPLTLVAKAAPHVPDLLMANTGFVACRSPQHPISIALIKAAKVPIAAPSANKFGHVSPTRAHHVWDDLKYEDVWIVDTDEKETTSICAVGVESSVAKIEMADNNSGKITLLRQGAVCVADIKKCLDEAGLAQSFTVEAKTKRATDETVAHVAPGQTIRHYSPDIPSFILSEALCKGTSQLSSDDVDFLSKTVIIDFRGKLRKWKDQCMAYRELSESGDSSLATKAVFETLRWAERVANAEQIIFPEIAENEPGKDDALVLALKDRLTRAASGVVIDNLKVKH